MISNNMALKHRPKNMEFSVGVALAIIFVGVLTAVVLPSLREKEVACTTEALICPDGSSIGRSGPNCEFAECPKMTEEGWKDFLDPGAGVSFRYPEKLSEKYISAVDWPPKVAILKEPFTCLEAGSETGRAGITESLAIGERDFCVTRESGGAAGSVYTNYAYATPVSGKTVILTFSLRAVQCGNYDDPQKVECEAERSSFDIGPIINKIAASLKIEGL